MILVYSDYKEIKIQGDSYLRKNSYTWYALHDVSWEYLDFKTSILLEQEYDDFRRKSNTS